MASSLVVFLLSYINEEYDSDSSAITVQDQDGSFHGNSMAAHIRGAAGGEEGSDQAQKRQKT